jgi:glycosyltransferase involved in cell wall biosynthesis
MRVLHVNNERTWRGGERQTLLTAVEQRRQGVDSQIACRGHSTLEQMASSEGVPTISLPSASPGALLGLARAGRAFDLLHCHTGRAHSLGALSILIRPKPCVVSRRVDFLPGNSRFNHWKYRRVDRVVCVSKCIEGILRRWGVAAEKTEVIYEAVPAGPYASREESSKEIRERIGLSSDDKLVGNIAALVGHKDQATLLRAAAVVIAKRPKVAFVIVGQGELEKSLLELRSQLHLESVVHFTGFIPQAQRLMPAFDVFAMSSSMEGLGTIVLDAGMARVPVAATAGGGLPEVVIDEQTGLLVPVANAEALANAIMRLLDEPDLALKLATNAQRRVQTEFSVPHMAGRYVDVYHRILGRAA